MDRHEQYTLKLVSAINEVFNPEADNFIGELEDVDATVLFTSMLAAVTYMFNELTGEDKDLIEASHLLNRLAVQHLLNIAKGEIE